jgi:hypothetical protein
MKSYKFGVGLLDVGYNRHFYALSLFLADDIDGSAPIIPTFQVQSLKLNVLSLETPSLKF